MRLAPWKTPANAHTLATLEFERATDVRVTLDTNAIIDLEESRRGAAAITELIALNAAGQVQLCVSAIAASERYRDTGGDPHFGLFTEKLANVGLQDAELLNPIGYRDVTFWGHAVFCRRSRLTSRRTCLGDSVSRTTSRRRCPQKPAERALRCAWHVLPHQLPRGCLRNQRRQFP